MNNTQETWGWKEKKERLIYHWVLTKHTKKDRGGFASGQELFATNGRLLVVRANQAHELGKGGHLSRTQRQKNLNQEHQSVKVKHETSENGSLIQMWSVQDELKR